MPSDDIDAREGDDAGVERFIGGYIYDQSDDPRWGHIEDVQHEDGEVTFTTSPIDGHAVPETVRLQVLEDYDGGVTIVEVEV